MTKTVGNVVWVGSKAWGQKVFWSFKCDDDTFYRTGTAQPGVEKGDTIEFEWKMDDKNNKQVDVKSISKVAKPAAARGKVQNLDKDSYWANKEQRDVERDLRHSYGASMNTAIAIVNNALEQGALVLPAAKAKKLDALVGYIDTITLDLFNRNQNLETYLSENGNGTSPVEEEEEEGEPDFTDEELSDD